MAAKRHYSLSLVDTFFLVLYRLSRKREIFNILFMAKINFCFGPEGSLVFMSIQVLFSSITPAKIAVGLSNFKLKQDSENVLKTHFSWF